jgi:hypothetical protein
MSLARYMDWLPRKKNVDVPHYGIVKFNDDPKQLGRIKVRIDGMWETDEASLLPWVYPVAPSFLGYGNGASVFAVPEIDSKVVVTFPYGNINFGFYTGVWFTSTPTEFVSDYPNSYGFADGHGNSLVINKTTEVTTYTHSSGTNIIIAKNGNITINSVKDVNINSEGDTNITATGDVVIIGADIKLNP